MKRKFLALLIALFMVATALSACGGDKGGKEADSGTTQNKSEDSSGSGKSEKKDNSADADADDDSEDDGDVDDDSDQGGGDDLLTALKERFTIGYVGVGDDDSEFYWAVDETVSEGLLFIVNADKTQSVTYIGAIEEEDGGWLRIKDESTGGEIKVQVEDVSDSDRKSIKLTTEDGSFAVLASAPADQVIDGAFEAEAEVK